MYSVVGYFSSYLGTEEEKLPKAVKLVKMELHKLSNQPLSGLQLQRAKQKFKGQIALAEENRMSMIIAEAKNILDYNRVITLAEVFTKIDDVQTGDIQELATEFFDPRRLLSLSFVPED